MTYPSPTEVQCNWCVGQRRVWAESFAVGDVSSFGRRSGEAKETEIEGRLESLRPQRRLGFNATSKSAWSSASFSSADVVSSQCQVSALGPPSQKRRRRQRPHRASTENRRNVVDQRGNGRSRRQDGARRPIPRGNDGRRRPLARRFRPINGLETRQAERRLREELKEFLCKCVIDIYIDIESELWHCEKEGIGGNDCDTFTRISFGSVTL